MVIYKGGFEPSFRSITRPNVISLNSWQVGAVPPFEYGKKLKKEGSADQDKPPVQLLVGSPCKERPMALLLSLTLQGIKRLSANYRRGFANFGPWSVTFSNGALVG